MYDRGALIRRFLQIEFVNVLVIKTHYVFPKLVKQDILTSLLNEMCINFPKSFKFELDSRFKEAVLTQMSQLQLNESK